MEMNQYTSIYFVGAGGIGMSALVRYFLSIGKQVAGYDRTATELTHQLVQEGANLHYEDDVHQIPETCKQISTTLVIYTPAIPKDHKELNYFQQKGFKIYKRAQVLGLLTRSYRGLCVAGTHGKTTTSTLLAHLMHQSSVDCTAFLGGIAQNYHSNLLLAPEKSPYVVIEADEYDRSFHQLYPYITAITSSDADHLDIYGTSEAYRESFEHYTSLIQDEGVLLMHVGVDLTPRCSEKVRIFSYGRDKGDYHADNVRIGGGEIWIDVVLPQGEKLCDIQLGVPMSINIENSIAAIAIAHLCGVTADEIRAAMSSFKGIERRFDFKIKRDDLVFLTDYAHHPAELEASISSLRELYPNKKLTGVFQPHLYSRTHDFYEAFAASLALLDEVILLPIYPARELPIPGVTSQLIYDALPHSQIKTCSTMNELVEMLAYREIEVLITLGAGDIDTLNPTIKTMLEQR
jgi:UDP-N-acetylmuramate--alanine ligase